MFNKYDVLKVIKNLIRGVRKKEYYQIIFKRTYKKQTGSEIQ